MVVFNRRANLVSCGPLFLSIFRRRRARRIPRRQWRHVENLMERTFFFSNRAHTRWEHFCFRFFYDLSGVQAEFFPDYWNNTADFWERLRSFRSSQSTAESVFIWSLQNLLDRPDRPDRTQFYSSDRGRLRRLGRLRSSWQCSHLVVRIVWTLFETTGTIGTIICMETRL